MAIILYADIVNNFDFVIVQAWDITKQLVETERGQGINVVLGGGRGSFTPNKDLSPEDLEASAKWNCSRLDQVSTNQS